MAIGEPALDACIIEASDRSSNVQFRALNCLTKFKSPRVVEVLVELL